MKIRSAFHSMSRARAARVAVALAVVATSVGAAPAVAGAPSDEEAVIAVVQGIFDAMAAHDGPALEARLLPGGTLHSTRPGGGARSVPFGEWVASVAGADRAFLERMWTPQVTIHGDIAVLWTPYDFWLGGEFSHCGIDVFTLLRSQDTWKVATVTYTVEPTGCEASPLGPPR